MLSGFRITGFLVALFLVTTTLADVPESSESVAPVSSDPDADEVNLEAIDEIVVVEQKSVPKLRNELAKADDRVFSLYNDLNTDDSLDMICKKETRIGSQIKHRVCKSAYHRQLQSESGSDFLEGDDSSTSGRAPSGHYEKVRSNMTKLMNEHPELGLAFIQRALLRKKIAEQKEKR